MLADEGLAALVVSVFDQGAADELDDVTGEDVRCGSFVDLVVDGGAGGERSESTLQTGCSQRLVQPLVHSPTHRRSVSRDEYGPIPDS